MRSGAANARGELQRKEKRKAGEGVQGEKRGKQGKEFKVKGEESRGRSSR
jgi:hypothetical protein